MLVMVKTILLIIQGVNNLNTIQLNVRMLVDTHYTREYLDIHHIKGYEIKITLILRVFSCQLSQKLKFLSPDFLKFKNPIYRENEIFTTYFLHDFGSFLNSLSDDIGGFSYF